MSVIASISKEGFSLSANSSRDGVIVCLAGNCDMDATPSLAAFLDDLHTQLFLLQGRRIVFDCTQLYFMNSAGIKCFVVWIAKVRALNEQQRCRVEFVTNHNLGWQKRSLEAIQRFASDIVTLT